MVWSFGARLRQRREEQRLSLTAVAEQTKIKRSLLDEIERDDVSHWPTGFFGRAFIRAYAQAIGLDPDVVVREFLEAHPEPVEVVAAGPGTASAGDSGLRSIVSSTLVGYLGRLRRGAPSSATAVAPVLAPASAAPVAVPAPDVARAAAESATAPGAGPAPVPAETPTSEITGTSAPSSGSALAPASAAAPARSAAAPAARVPLEKTRPIAARQLDFEALAEVCTALARVQTIEDLQRHMREAGKILDAAGLILWVWDAASAELRPWLSQGYADEMLAQLPPVKRDTNNATAAAFRSQQTVVIDPTDRVSGALAVPLLTPSGCAGVVALELPRGVRHTPSRRAATTILAAVVAQLIGT